MYYLHVPHYAYVWHTLPYHRQWCRDKEGVSIMLTTVQMENINTMLDSLPTDVAQEIRACMDAWLRGDTTSGYPHPTGVVSTLRNLHHREPFLTEQEALNMSILQSLLKAI
jgi:hypothetical protein